MKKLLFFFLTIFSIMAQAEDVPPTYTFYMETGFGHLSGSTVSSVATQFCSNIGGSVQSIDGQNFICSNNANTWQVQQSHTCPSGSSDFGTYCSFPTSCVLPQVRQPDGTCSVPPVDCSTKTHTVQNESGSIDMGTSMATSTAQLQGCQEGCTVKAVDYRPGAEQSGTYYTALVAGVTHYLVTSVISYTGGSCSTGTPPVPNKVSDTCASGDIYIKVAGKSACVTPSTSTVKAVAPTLTQTPKGTEPQTVQSTTNPTNPSTPSVTTVTTINHDSSGDVTSVSSTSINTVNNTYNENGSQGEPIDMSGVEAKLDSINSKLNVTGTVSGNATGYTSTANAFYTSKYPNGISDVWSTAKQNLSNSSLGSLITSFTPDFGNSGNAPMWIFNFNLGPLGNYGSHSIGPDSSLWTILSIILIVTSLFVARVLVFGG